MSDSWDYTLRRLAADESNYWPCECSWPMCKETPTHEGTFKSVTGRAGRVNTRRKALCDAHAASFAERNGVTVDA